MNKRGGDGEVYDMMNTVEVANMVVPGEGGDAFGKMEGEVEMKPRHNRGSW